MTKKAILFTFEDKGFMGFNYVPPQIIYQATQRAHCDTYQGTPYFYEVGGQIINLAAATSFYVDHLPLTSYYWPKAKIGGDSYQLTAAMESKEEAMAFLRALTTKIEQAHRVSE